MSEVIRVTLFVPGVAPAAWSRPLGPGYQGEWIANDGEFGKAFSFGTVAPDVIAAIDAAPGALVVHCPVDLREGREAIVTMVERLRDAGGIAVRIEQSKVGWDVHRWLELFTSDDPWAWHRGAVMFLHGDGTLRSCGMHAFSLPDVCVPIDGDPRALQELASTLDVYQLAEDPVLRSGQTFAPDAETARRVIERWPDDGYPPDHPCHNPYGVWRLGPPGGAARPVGNLVFVFTPALCAILTALERQHRAPLDQAQVVAARDQAACIATEPRDARKLEHARGYADLEPDLAWEQWQVMRSNRAL